MSRAELCMNVTRVQSNKKQRARFITSHRTLSASRDGRCSMELPYLFRNARNKYLHGSAPFPRSWQFLSYSRNSPQLMEAENSLPCSQKSAPPLSPTLSHINPAHAPSHDSTWKSNLILSSHLHLRLPSGFFHSGGGGGILSKGSL